MLICVNFSAAFYIMDMHSMVIYVPEMWAKLFDTVSMLPLRIIFIKLEFFMNKYPSQRHLVIRPISLLSLTALVKVIILVREIRNHIFQINSLSIKLKSVVGSFIAALV